MAKIIVRSALLVSLVFIIGCREEASTDPQLLIQPHETALAEGTGFGVPDAREVDLVEQMATYRSLYREDVGQLIDYYTKSGDATKLAWAKKELISLDRIPKYKYLMPAETVDANLRATDSIIAADELYAEAEKLYKEAGALIVISDNAKLRDALAMFNKLIVTYPTSDKIDKAAYRAGRIYEHFKDYEIASVYYQRAFQWNPETTYPARFKAAYVMDRRLHKRAEALVLYKLSVEKEAGYENNTKYAKRRIATLTTLKDVPEPEPEPENNP